MSSQVRQNFHQDCEAAINRQINLELYASYVYLSMVSLTSYQTNLTDAACLNCDDVVFMCVHAKQQRLKFHLSCVDCRLLRREFIMHPGKTCPCCLLAKPSVSSYQAYYFDRDDQALHNFAKFFRHQSHEEREHAEKLMKMQNQRGGRIFLQDVRV